MKNYKIAICFALAFFAIYKITPSIAQQLINAYILEHESDIALQQAGTHNGGGNTTGYNFFSKVKDLKMVFKKRILHPGSGIGYHLQKEDEIYYVVDGIGEMQMNGETFPVKAGDAILTRPGSSHGIKNTSDKDLTLIINYEKK